MADPEIVTTVDPPSPTDQLAEAEAAVRAYAGWHIAPVRTDTIKLPVNGGPIIVLPTRMLRSVASVTINGQTIDRWTWREYGTLFRWRWWPPGDAVVTFTHGYDDVPDLHGVIRDVAARAVGTGPFVQVGQVRVGTDKATGMPLGATLTEDEKAAIEPYRLMRRP